MKGLNNVLNNVSKLEQKTLKIAKYEALEDLGNKIGEISQDSVPLDEGTLRRSFTVQKQNGKTVAGYNTEYAAYQHQGKRKDGSHITSKYTKSGVGPFFLSNPIQKNKQNLLKYLQQRIKARLSL
jgi:phage gpG-like protein